MASLQSAHTTEESQIPLMDLNTMSKEDEGGVQAHFNLAAGVGVGKPALINPVPATIANKLPQLGVEHKNYNDAVKAYKELAHSGRFAVNFPTYGKKRNGNTVFNGLKSYSLGEWHPTLKRTVDINDAKKQAKILNNMSKMSDAYGNNYNDNIVTEKHGGLLKDYADQNKETHDVAKQLQDEVRGLPSSVLVGPRRLGKNRIRRITTPDGVQHDTTTDHPIDNTKFVGIDGREKHNPKRGGRKTRKHKRKHKRKTKRKTSKHKTKTKKTNRKTKRKTNRKTKRKTKKHRR